MRSKLDALQTLRVAAHPQKPSQLECKGAKTHSRTGSPATSGTIAAAEQLRQVAYGYDAPAVRISGCCPHFAALKRDLAVGIEQLEHDRYRTCDDANVL
jgi:hypothetical protein